MARPGTSSFGAATTGCYSPPSALAARTRPGEPCRLRETPPETTYTHALPVYLEAQSRPTRYGVACQTATSSDPDEMPSAGPSTALSPAYDRATSASAFPPVFPQPPPPSDGASILEAPHYPATHPHIDGKSSRTLPIPRAESSPKSPTSPPDSVLPPPVLIIEPAVFDTHDLHSVFRGQI